MPDVDKAGNMAVAADTVAPVDNTGDSIVADSGNSVADTDIVVDSVDWLDDIDSIGSIDSMMVSDIQCIPDLEEDIQTDWAHM
jgi:hypothetical protein